MDKSDEENKELKKKRRIPLEKKFMCKKINDILYGYLQSIASFNPNTNTLYVKKDDINQEQYNQMHRDICKKIEENYDKKYDEQLEAYDKVKDFCEKEYNHQKYF